MFPNLFRLSARKIKKRVPDSVRIYAIGDIHGRADLLAAVLARIDHHLTLNPIPRPVLVLLGDYIDRGPNSREVIDILLKRKSKEYMICLKGNHERYAAKFLNDPSVLPEWNQVGGIYTLMSYGIRPSSRNNPQALHDVAAAFRQVLPESHRRFLHGLALSFTTGDYFFTHAGVRPGVSLPEQSEEDLLSIRGDFLSHHGEFDKVVVHGHTPTMEPEFYPNRINIDTGAYTTGRLTCLVFEEDKITIL